MFHSVLNLEPQVNQSGGGGRSERRSQNATLQGKRRRDSLLADHSSSWSTRCAAPDERGSFSRKRCPPWASALPCRSEKRAAEQRSWGVLFLALVLIRGPSRYTSHPP